MRTARIAIVGGGLSGLYAALLLEQRGMTDYVLLEARHTLGGRIASTPDRSDSGVTSGEKDINRFDLGPTWFWPAVQSQLDRLVQHLGLTCFEQHETGDMVVERSTGEPPVRMRGYANSPTSMRVVGGMASLIDALRRRVDSKRIVTGQNVQCVRSMDDHIELNCVDVQGRTTLRYVEHVLLAVPPRLAEQTIQFTPSLPQELARQWRNTATWMAPHAKYVAIYDTPFWREQGLSGEARSACGPLGEIHDASMPGGSAALFGFFAIPARVRNRVPEDGLRAHCRAQLGRLFGMRAATPVADIIKDWAWDSYTATAADLDSNDHQGISPSVTATSEPWHGRLTGIASEWSRQFPGYVAGAVDAASRGVHAIPEITAKGER